MTDFGDQFQRMLEGNRPRPRAPQAQGLQEGLIVDVDQATVTFTLLGDDRHLFGPAPFSRSSTPPQVGDRCLVAFVGTGIDRPWITAWCAP